MSVLKGKGTYGIVTVGKQHLKTFPVMFTSEMMQ